VVRGDAEPFERDAVLRRAIAGVAFPAVPRMLGGEPFHDPVARHLGGDRGGGNGKAEAVAFHDRARRHGEFRRDIAVDQRRLRHLPERGHGALHGEQGRLENVQAVDFPDLGNADADIGAAGHLREQRFPDGSFQLLGIVEARGQRVRQARAVKYRRCRDDRPGPWAAARFVDSGDAAAHFGFHFPGRHSSPACPSLPAVSEDRRVA